MATAEQYAEWIVANQGKKGSPEFETVAEAYKLARAPMQTATPATAQTSLKDDIVSAYATGPETVAALGTGAVGAVVGGLAGLAQGAKNLVSPGMSAGDRVQQVQQALTYQPRTAGGQLGTQIAAYIPEKIAEGADAVGGNVAEATGSPALGAGVNTALQAAPQLLARGLKAPVQGMMARAETRAADLKSVNSVKDKTLADAREAGYVFPPSEINQTAIGTQVESLGGKAAMAQDANRRNQQITNRIGREEAGVATNQPLSVDTLQAARERISAPYREVTAVSSKAATALENVQRLRREAHDEWESYAVSRNTDVKKKAQALDSEAKAQEGVIDLEAVRIGKTDLLNRVREARKELAKNYDVERALNVGSGDLDAHVWGRMLDRGKPLSGQLAVAARAAEAMSRFTKEVSSVPSPSVSKFGPIASTALGIGGYAAMGPAGVLAAGVPMLASPARSLALSNMMQRPRTYGHGSGVGALSVLTQNPNAYAAIPALGGILSQLQEP